MKTKIFKLTTNDLETFQAICNVDISGKVTVHYINAWNYKEVELSIVKELNKLIDKWVDRNGFTLWAY